MENPQTFDEYYMARCLMLAERGRGNVSPNPMVGAVVLDRHGKKVGEGFHPKAGSHHAEVIALDTVGTAAQGGTLYVSLEPCNHTGKTPPCTDKIVEAGIQKVICGMGDPNPLVAGSGIAALQDKGISVQTGILEKQCRALNEIFCHHITTGRPFVTLKLAMTLDGKIATRSGQSQWLTGSFSRQYVHRLRAGYDAILTTAETVLADNPQMTVRDIPGMNKQPIRVILDRRFRLNAEEFQIFDTQMSPTWVLTSKIQHHQPHAKLARLRGAEVMEVDETGVGLDLAGVLTVLGQQGVTSVFVEAGGQLAGSLLEQGLVNKLYLFYAPMILSDPVARQAFSGSVQFNLANAPRLEITKTQQLEQDWVVEAYPVVTSNSAC